MEGVNRGYKRLVFAVGEQAWGDIEHYLKSKDKDLEQNTKNRIERDFKTSMHFFTVPYCGEGETIPDESYFAYLLSLIGLGDGLAMKIKRKCLEIEAALKEEKKVARKAAAAR